MKTSILTSILLMCFSVASFSQTLATEPTAQASSLLFSSIKSYRINGNFSAASPSPSGYLVLRKTGAAVNDIPIDGTVYQRGDIIGSSQVISSGNSLSFMPRGIVANTQYYFSVFSYNGVDSAINYLTSNPLNGMATSLNAMLTPNYYGSISTSNSSFVTDLHDKIYPHTKQTYSNYGDKFIAPFIARDTVGNKRVITCAYSGENVIYTEPWDWTSNGFSREHTFPKSWMPTVNTSNFENKPEYSDYHQLFPVNQNKANAVRSNYPLGEVVTITGTYRDAKVGYTGNGQMVYEPRDAQKGDAARAIMYQAVCYNGIDGYEWILPNPISGSVAYGQNQTVLKKWHYQDPPDNFEIARNDFLDSLQSNRNPFVDHPDYACYIDFTTMTYIASPTLPCNIVSVAEKKKTNPLISIAPNPNDGNFKLLIAVAKSRTVTIQVSNVLGQVVSASKQKLIEGANSIHLHLAENKSGVYSVMVLFDNEQQTKKVIINN